jgi:hypothetical protein
MARQSRRSNENPARNKPAASSSRKRSAARGSKTAGYLGRLSRFALLVGI